MSFTEQEIRDRLMVAIGATGDIENIYVRRRAAKAAAPEVLAIIQELADRLTARARRAPDPHGRYHSFVEVARVLVAEIASVPSKEQG
jgi:hypothetical protein